MAEAQGKNPNHLPGSTVLVVLLGVGAWIWWMTKSPPGASANPVMRSVHYQVQRDAEQQYEIVKRGGDKVQLCVQAGLVSASYLQANDEAGYQKWSAIERADCARAGIQR